MTKTTMLPRLRRAAGLALVAMLAAGCQDTIVKAIGPENEPELTVQANYFSYFADNMDNVYDEITANFVPLKFDVTHGTDQDEERKARYKAGTLPAVVFLDSEGNRLAHIKKMMDADAMLKIVRPAVRKLKARAQTP